MKLLQVLLLLALSVKGYAASYEIGRNENVNGYKRINVVQRLLSDHMRPDQLRNHKLISLKIWAIPEDFGSMAQLWVAGHLSDEQFFNPSRIGERVQITLSSTQVASPFYFLDLNGRMKIDSIVAELKSLQPTLSNPVHLTNFHAGRWDSVRRDISVDMNRSVGEFVLTAKSNEVEIKSIHIVYNHGGVQELRQYRDYDIDEGSNLVIRFGQNYGNFIRSLVITAKSDSPFGSEAELFVAARYWD